MKNTSNKAKSSDASVILEVFSKYKLNKLVQAELFTHDYKHFSGFINELMGGFLQYGIIMGNLQKGLYNNSGADLKRLKNVKNYTNDKKSITKYMSPLELIRYREALNSLKDAFLKLNASRITNANIYYNEALDIGDTFYNKFKKYLKINSSSSEPFIERSGISLDDSIIKTFNKGLKIGLCKNIVKAVALNYDPYSDEPFAKYEVYRKDFVNVVSTLKSYGFLDLNIKTLFNNYEKIFYNTNYLEDKNICILDYSLGLNDDFYFSQEELITFKKQLESFKYIISAINDYCKYNTLTKEQKYNEINKYIKSEALKNRKQYIDYGLNLSKRPETSNVFIVACLEKIIIEKKLNNYSPAFLDVPRSFTEKAIKVAESIVEKEKHSPRQSTIWDSLENKSNPNLCE